MTHTRAAMVLIAVFVAGCTARAPLPELDPSVAADAVSATAPDRPLQAVFDWRIQDREARFTGSGVARIEPPYRARLDLFGPRGEGYLSAAVVDAELRLPPGTGTDVPLPPPAMMWAVLGVVAPPDGAVLAGTLAEAERSELQYRVGESELRYVLSAGRLRSATWEDGGRRMTVEIGEYRKGVPANAVYRDWSGYTELSIDVEEVHEVESFPVGTWTPDA